MGVCLLGVVTGGTQKAELQATCLWGSPDGTGAPDLCRILVLAVRQAADKTLIFINLGTPVQLLLRPGVSDRLLLCDVIKADLISFVSSESGRVDTHKARTYR